MKQDIFHSTSIKLASLYVMIIMSISFVFSFLLYNVSLSEIRESTRGHVRRLQSEFPSEPRIFAQNLRGIEEYTLENARKDLRNQLLVLNIGIAIFSAVASYYLARRTLKPIEEANESLERFTADASHELRTPIAVMRSENEVALMDSKLTLAQAKKQLESNIEELEKLTALSEGLLQLANQDDLPKSLVSTKKIVDSAINSVAGFAKSKKVTIKGDVSENLQVNADENTLAQALVILLNNAVKYSKEKTEVLVHVSKKQKNIVFKVVDHGAGINATDLPHIFDRFYRADSSRNKQGSDGYGLGLAIAKNIVELHGGRISASSKTGKGSTFIISLPTS